MKFPAVLARRLTWFNLPVALLFTLLQRTPAVRVAAAAGEHLIASPLGQVLRSATAAFASLGALHSLAGATTLSVSSGSLTGTSVAIGAQLGPIALGTIGTLSQPLSWQIAGNIPAGISLLSSSGTALTSAGTLNTPSGVMLHRGSPTGPAGTYTLTLIAYEFANRTGDFTPPLTYTITVTGGTATTPAITTGPAAQSINAGGDVTFSVTATGTSLAYQWRKDGATLAGATTATLALTNVTAASAGVYSVVVSNSAGSVTSSNATLTVSSVATVPAITTQPLSQFGVVGSSVTFSVAATGNPAPTFQWLKNSLPIIGSTNTTFTLTNLTLADAANYTVNVSNSLGTVTSAAATLNIDAARTAPAIVSQPPPALNLVAGQSLALNVGASGSGLSYQWRRVGAGGTTDVAGASAASFALRSVTAADAGIYFCVVSNAVGSETSSGAVIAVAASSASPGRLTNLSVLTTLASAGDSFSLGYVVSGATTANPKPLILRAAGPSLGALGVGGTHPDPKLETFAGSVKTGENDNWGGAAAITTGMAAVGAFPYTTSTSLDAAIAGNITARDNSVRISGGASAPNATGSVIGEVYDATPASNFNPVTTPRLINLSVSKNVGTSLTMGFVIGGTTAKTMLVRAVGPGLAVFGVPGTIADPKVELFSDTGKSLATNDNWGGTTALSTAFNDTGAFTLPVTSNDAALLITLPPGNYTAQVGVATGSTGLALVEVYEVP